MAKRDDLIPYSQCPGMEGNELSIKQPILVDYPSLFSKVLDMESWLRMIYLKLDAISTMGVPAPPPPAPPPDEKPPQDEVPPILIPTPIPAVVHPDINAHLETHMSQHCLDSLVASSIPGKTFYATSVTLIHTVSWAINNTGTDFAYTLCHGPSTPVNHYDISQQKPFWLTTAYHPLWPVASVLKAAGGQSPIQTCNIVLQEGEYIWFLIEDIALPVGHVQIFIEHIPRWDTLQDMVDPLL